jgi:hypothetical protein
MLENAYRMAGIIELDADPSPLSTARDDSTLERLFASLVGRDAADETEAGPPDHRRGSPRWTRVGEDLVYDGRPTISADLGALLRELELEYELVCDALREADQPGE